MIKKILFLSIILFGLCACSNDTNENNNITINDEITLSELKEIVENNVKLIEELTNKNKELEEKITTLEENNKSLNDNLTTLQNRIVALEENNKTVNSTINNNYNELKNLITRNSYSLTNNYLISKNQLLGTWYYGNNNITFTDENLYIYDNWFEWKGMAFSYIYKDGKLYISDDGLVMTK